MTWPTEHLMFSRDLEEDDLSRWAPCGKRPRHTPTDQDHYHTDGNATRIAGEMVDAGLDILNPLQPECNGLTSPSPPRRR